MGKRQDRNTFLIIVVIVIISIAAFSVALPVQAQWSETGDETGSNFSASIVAYKDGVPVSEPVLMGSFTRDGALIDSFVVLITWHGSGSGVDWSTFSLAGYLRVSYLNEYDNYLEEFSTTFDSTNADGTWTKTLVLGTDVCKMENILYGGWYLEFKATLAASVQDTATGATLTDDVAFAGTVNILFDSEFSLDGDWGY